VDLLVVVIVSTAMGLVNTVHYLSRLREFALMSAIGLTPATLVLRTIVEVLSLGLVGFGGGLAAAKVTVSLLSACLFRPRGIEIAGIGWRSIVFAIPVPILVSVFSTITIWFNILKLDVVAYAGGSRLLITTSDVGICFSAGDTKTWALRHVSLSVEAGQVIMIFGPSGSGKSSLLYLAERHAASQQ